ncbi:beta2 tomatinase [Plectosphaerella plurivora]|uniref:Beta-glucosidase cel3A n=1 Tax=Plectosphaerella plurivora TaxID=936078 RepID=A0A9P8V1S3_9PEZI|nr:beta2 tomatinase [Plectosphaerella plurivora]
MKALTSFIWLLAIGANAQDGHFQPIDVYPSPLAKARALVKQLTLEEKAAFVTGTSGPCAGNSAAIPRLNFRGICFQDSPVGVREADFVTVFPAGFSVAASFDKRMIYQRADMMGSEFRGKGIQAAFGPAVGGMGRHALGGRNWEGFGIDLYLVGVAMDLSVRGLQKHGVQSVGKHHIANEQETQRFPSQKGGKIIEALSSNIDDRAMHELYLWPFAQGLRAGVSYVMCGYNRLNQTCTCKTSKALNGLLKEELGFQGAVISDWGATKSGLHSIEAGLDVTMPGERNSPFGSNIYNLVQNGSLPESRLDDMIHRVLTPFFLHGQDSDNYPALDPSINELKDHGDFVRALGAPSALLLKNDGALPLGKPKNIAVFGNDGADLSEGQFEATLLKDSIGPGYGTMAQGGGSGSARYSYFVSPLEAIKKRGQEDGALVQYILSNQQAAESIHTIYPMADVCLVFLKTISLDVDWNGTAVVNTVSARCPNTVVITHSPGINLMPWADNPNVTAIIAAHLPGQEAGNAIVDILYGKVNPSGKLPCTIAFEESDYNPPIANITGSAGDEPNAWQADFTEGLWVDYRHFDAANITPRYEYGLSYTTFEHDLPSVSNRTRGVSPFPPSQNVTQPGGNAALYDALITVTGRVRNTGKVEGAAVAQLYASFPDSAPEETPVKVLRGFEKTSVLAPGAEEVVTFELHRRDVSFWDVDAQDWRVPGGDWLGVTQP